MTNDELRINKTTKSQDFSIRNCSLNIENWYSSEGVPHHLLDIADPNDDYNVSHFLRDARIAIEDIANRGKLTILCGGTGFWIQALVENQELPDIPPNPTLRETLSQKTPGELFEMLRKLDSARAKQIDRNNPHRLIRAIEIARDKNYELSITNYQLLVSSRIVSSSLKIDHCTLIIALCPPKDVLDAKIRARLDARFAEGMIEEVTKLHDKGVSWERLDAFGLEYRWISRYLRRMIGEKEMKEKLFFESIHYAKRQMTWIRRWHRSNPALHIIETPEEAMDLAGTFLETEK